MNLSEAHSIVQRILAPMPLDRFLDEVLGRAPLRVGGDPAHPRAALLGEDPAGLLLAAFARLAPTITSHAEAPTEPAPAAEAVADADAFLAKVAAFHDRGYTVRLPDVSGLSAPLDRFLRALEALLHVPVESAVFWGRGEARAPVHYDEVDVLVLQLRGSKRWFIAKETALPNRWRGIPSAAPTLGEHVTTEVGPGDLLYLPRGTHHRVDALADSIHLSIGFVPLTVRDAMIAAIDHLSDHDRSFRETIGQRLAPRARTHDFGGFDIMVQDGARRLLAAAGQRDFVPQALQRRSSRALAELPKLARPAAVPAIDAATRLRHAPLAACHLSGTAETIDFAYPGGHLHIHRGAERALLFMAETPAFRLADAPAEPDIARALAERLLAIGYLEVDATD